MGIRPPDAALGQPRQWKFSSRNFNKVLLALALLSGWQLSGLPGQLVHRHVPPADRPWFPYGIRTAFLSAEGELIIKRKGYLDRTGTYTYDYTGELERGDDEGEIQLAQDDVSGIYRGNRKRSQSMMGIEINPSWQYHQWIAAVKDHSGDQRRLAEVMAGDGSEFLTGPLTYPEPYVEIALYPDDKLAFPMLDGEQFYPVFDSAAYIEPYLWLTTGRASMLHLLWIREEPTCGVTAIKSAPTGTAPQDSNSILGLDPRRDELFLISADGQRRWFDSRTLEPAGVEQLEGEWRFEFGALSVRHEEFSFHHGLPLSEQGYLRTMRTLMVVFLASLLWLMLNWSRRWMSILERTTADTTQKPS